MSKRRIFIVLAVTLLITFAANSGKAQTRNIVPRNDNEGAVGTELKKWTSGYYYTVYPSTIIFADGSSLSSTEGQYYNVSVSTSNYALRIGSYTKVDATLLPKELGINLGSSTTYFSEIHCSTVVFHGSAIVFKDKTGIKQVLRPQELKSSLEEIEILKQEIAILKQEIKVLKAGK